MAATKDVGIRNMPSALWDRLAARATKERRSLKQVLIASIEAYLGPTRKRGK